MYKRIAMLLCLVMLLSSFQINATIRGELDSELIGEIKKESPTITTNSAINLTTKGVIALSALATDDGFIPISTAEEFMTIKDNLQGQYTLMNDIDFAGINFVPIGGIRQRFKGSLNGNGYVLKNIDIAGSSNPYNELVGIFAYLEDASIKNLIIDNISVRGNRYVGSLAGLIKNSSISNLYINNCNIEGVKDRIGGLLGAIDDDKSVVSSTVVNGIVKGDTLIGGLVGGNSGGIINLCAFNGEVIGGQGNIGGISGYSSGKISNCYNHGNVSGDQYIGGIAGNIYDTVENCYNTGEVTCNTSSTKFGGIVGYLRPYYGRVMNSYYDTKSCIGSQRNEFGSAIERDGLFKRETFEGWDFEKIWGINEGLNYPYLRSNEINKLNIPNKLTGSGIEGILKLNWEEVFGAIGYEVSINGEVFNSTDSYYQTEDYETGLYKIKIRAYRNKIVSQWSSEISVTVEDKPFGTRMNPYKVSNINELLLLRQNPDKYFILTSNIDLSNSQWIPIDNFTGSLDGNGFRISNIAISNNDALGALFGTVGGEGIVKNLTLENIMVDATGYGASIAAILEEGTIENCKVIGISEIRAPNCGGIVGLQRGNKSKVLNCKTNIKISGDLNTGGVIGIQESGILRLSSSNSKVNGNDKATGGLIGRASGTIEESYTKGITEGQDNVGGLVGVLHGRIINSYSIASVNLKGKSGGGLIGFLDNGEVTNCYYAGLIDGDNVKGAVGSVSVWSVSSSYYNGEKIELQSDIYNESRLTQQMLLEETYEGWDFNDTWGIKQGKSYPYLTKLGEEHVTLEEPTTYVTMLGEGSPERPYLISDKSGLNIVKYSLGSYYKLTNDIYIDGKWKAIGSIEAAFKGGLDGDDYIIYNISGENGLFKVINGGEVKNLQIDNAAIIKSQDYIDEYPIGVIADEVQDGNIRNCRVINSRVEGYRFIGGLVGRLIDGNILECSFNGEIRGIEKEGYKSYYVGGIVGQAKGLISKSFSNGKVIGDEWIGGLVGTTSNIQITDSYSESEVLGNNGVGGIIGFLGNGKIANSYFNGAMKIKSNLKIGTMGVIGAKQENSSVTIQNCYFNKELNKIPLVDRVSVDATPLPIDQYKKTSTELKQKDTFENWDFTNIWAVKEGETTPYLRQVEIPKMNVKEKSLTSITLGWPSVTDSTARYELEIDKANILNLENALEYIHANLSNTQAYTYRIRAIVNGKKSRWSRPLVTAPHIPAPTNLRLTEIDGGLKVEWDGVDEANYYITYFNDEEIKTTGTTSTNTTIRPFNQYMIRVKAYNDITDSMESEVKFYIKIDEDGKAIYGVISEDNKIDLKVQNIDNLYTVAVSIKYNNDKVQLVKEEAIVGEDFNKNEIYLRDKYDEGQVKYIMSHTGDVKAWDGTMNLLKIPYKKLSNSLCQIEILIEAIDKNGEYLDTYSTSKLYIQ